jgi:hypothetical protein
MLMQSDVDRLYELDKEDLDTIIEQAHNALRLLKDKPCDCICHYQADVDHIVACCDRTYQQF